MTTRWVRAALLLVLVSWPQVACAGDDDGPPDEGGSDGGTGEDPQPPGTLPEPLRPGSFSTLIPQPTDVAPVEGELALVDGTVIVVDAGAAEVGGQGAAELLRGYLAPATGLELVIVQADDAEEDGDQASIRFRVASPGAQLGDEGYEMVISPDGVEVRAEGAAGFGWAVQTIRQLLPPEIESGTLQPGTFTLPAGAIRDAPRYGWRGAMLDVARHFFPPEEVERVVDLLALYKFNRLHLHLTDDQGWRLQIEQYPQLTSIGAATEIGGGPGGFYTHDQYRGLVDYAAARGITVVPEIDMPGHTAAALASLADLNCPGVPPPPVATDFSDGSSSLCATDQADATFVFVEEVVEEVASLTPGPYIHLGADEAQATSPQDFQRFLTRAADIVQAAGHQPIGWDEIATAGLGDETLVQYWGSPDNALSAADQGADLIMSPAGRAYLDMKYDESTPIGLTWAGTINTQQAYEWDPATVVSGLPPEQILGVEAPLWTETVTTLAEIEQMLLPRLPGYAEIGWSVAEGRSWGEYGLRLATHAARWTASGREYTRDPVVPWP